MQAKVWLIQAYRSRGSQLADLDPLGYQPACSSPWTPAPTG